MTENERRGVAYVVAFLVAVFVIVELLIAIGFIAPNNDADGIFANLQYGADKAFENPVLVAALITIVINAFGFLEDYVVTKEGYEAKEFLETFAAYEGFIIVLAQCLPIEYAIGLAVVIDVVRRLRTRI